MGICDSVEVGEVAAPIFQQLGDAFGEALDGISNQFTNQLAMAFSEFQDDGQNTAQAREERRKERQKKLRGDYKEPQVIYMPYGSDNNEQKVRKAENRATVKSQQGLPTQKDFIYQIRDLIVSKPQLCSVLVRQFFFNLSAAYSDEYWSSDSRELLIKALINYIKFNISQISSEKNETPFTLQNFAEKFGQDLYKLFNEVKMKNVWVINNLYYIRFFKNKKFSIQNHEEITALANDIKNLCANSTNALVFLSSYFVKCCMNLERSNVPPTKINEILKPEVTKIKQMFSPKSKLEEEMTYLKRSFEEEELSKLQTKKFPYNVITLTFSSANKEDQLGNFIMQMVQLAKKHFSSFTELTSTCCLENEGFAYKSNLKLKERKQQMPFLRVKEKLLKDKVEQFYKNKIYDCKTITQLKKAEIAYLESVLKQVYQKMDKIEFTVSDLLRGKCMFNKISHINAAAKKIIEKVEQRSRAGENIQIVEIDNRLSKITTDLVLKIRMQDLVCEFQLALKFNQAENQIHHKMYEVERSKVFTPVTMLFNWHQSIASEFFNSIDNILSERHKADTADLKFKLDDLKKFIEYSSDIKQSEKPKTFASKQDYDYIQKIKSQVDKMTVPAQLSKRALLRAGQCEKEMKKWKEALEALKQFEKSNPSDPAVFKEMGEVFKNRGQNKKAIQCFEKYIGLMSNINAKKQKQDVHEVYNLAAECQMQMSKNSQAIKTLEEIEKFTLQHFGEVSKQYGIVLSNMGQVLSRLGQGIESIKALETAISTFEKAKAKDNIAYPTAYKRLGQTYLKMGRHAAALEALNKALSLSQNITGKESLQTGQVYTSMGSVYQAMSKLKQSEQYFQKYLSIAENTMSKHSIQYAVALFYLSSLYGDMHKFKQAEEFLKISEQIIRTSLGTDSLEYMQVCNSYGLLYFSTNKPTEAIQQFSQAIQILKYSGEEQNPLMNVLMGNIALAYQNSGNYEQAWQWYEKSVQMTKKFFGEKSTQVAFLANNISTFLIALGKYPEAEQVLLQAIEIYRKQKVENDSGYTLALTNIGYLYIIQGQEVKSKPYFDEAFKIYEVTTGKDSVQYVELIFRIGSAYEDAGNDEKAKKQYQQALEMYKKLNHEIGIQGANKKLAELKIPREQRLQQAQQQQQEQEQGGGLLGEFF